MKPRTISHVNVPAGFSGWWCQHCDQAAPGIPEDLDAAQARCPRCHKWTAVWVPPRPEAGSQGAETDRADRTETTNRRPRGERSKKLFDHIRACIETPELNPDLSAWEHEQAIR